MTAVFSAKLDRIVDTVALVADSSHDQLATALRNVSATPILAVGSGGSLIAAQFLASCRSALGHSPTEVISPMASVLERGRPPSTPVWFFSASGNNPDILAAFETSVFDGPLQVDIVTSDAGGSLAQAAAILQAQHVKPRIHACPVADPKDGFLATHSVVSACATLVMAIDDVAGLRTEGVRRASLLGATRRYLAHDARRRLREVTFADFADRDTVLLLHDPHLAAAAVLIETSFWEAGIAAVQRTDFRNFAHGRHVWLSRHPRRTFIVALTCTGSVAYWDAIKAEIPQDIPSAHMDFGPAGRGSLFEAVVASLSLVEAAGSTKGVDPGRPGVADFGRQLFERKDLLAQAQRESASIRRKANAEIRLDEPGRKVTDWIQRREGFLAKLAATEFRAIVLDYDGTVVTTPDRLKPPRVEILAALIRLAASGLQLSFATGRGGSVGEMLRAHLPPSMHRDILVGYYNGAHVVSLDIDIAEHPPEADPLIGAVHQALCAQRHLFAGDWRPKAGKCQISIPFDALISPGRAFDWLSRELEAMGKSAGQTPWMTRSAHSIDIVSHGASKLRVVQAVRRIAGDDAAEVLRVGDSGDCQGNDHELLGSCLGLSVDRVCHRYDACWNLFPVALTGPDGLGRILDAIRPTGEGTAKLDVSVLFTN